jgi:hypothetical protein
VWTSSNQYAFLAIIAHYITNDGQLGMPSTLCPAFLIVICAVEELLIDFRELISEHSGENMTEAVWETLKQYGLIGQIIAIIMDNAMNNNTMMVAIEWCCNEAKVYFSAIESWLHCMPHTVHLAAIKVCVLCNTFVIWV